ncbi:MAG: (Fe-S)-binding protein [Desulfobacterota bacterium]|nr:(Fe-S)-binding protein [Thermodesulfobacteriota bacterium]MDW8001651.1 (Fe-S)-binding protein [Deltaproteobacteria bacterium]
MERFVPEKEVIEEIYRYGGERIKYCYQCGKCDAVCPWNRVRTLSVRKIIRDATFGLSEIEKEDIWICTTCGKCVLLCPRDVRQIEDMVALRRMATSYGVFPASVKTYRQVATYLTSSGNPFNEDPKERSRWAEELHVPTYEEGMEILLFVCCYMCYDPRLKNVAKAQVQLLKKAKVDFGILGDFEMCCGESIRKTGNEDVFKRLAKENIKRFVDFGVRRIVTSSPHCYYTFKYEYPIFGASFEIVHISEYIYKLIESKRLSIDKKMNGCAVYHDPCYLGRHSGIFEEPRKVLASVDSLKVLEFRENRASSLCCGMGGGRIWAETEKTERFSNIRVKEGVRLGVNYIVSACPYCITALEDSRLVLGYEEGLQIKDLTEIINEVT